MVWLPPPVMLRLSRKAMSVAANLARIKSTLGAHPVTLVAVSKGVDVRLMEEAFENGVTEFGENRVQDALQKQDAVPPYMADKIRWHFIGHLQTNKVKKVVGRFALIHSVDSTRLAEEISREASAANVTQPVLLQVKVVPDPSKTGFTPKELRGSIAHIMALPNLRVDGLMTITPYTADEGVWQQCFTGLRDLRDELQRACGYALKELSMGMTQDWEAAVESGATMIRLGRAVFGS